MKAIFLGTSAGQPSLSRNTTSIAVLVEGNEFILVDCGEATLLQLMRSSLKYSNIKSIFITHLHGDHVYGLPGLISTLNSQRTEPLTIFGPKGLKKFCSIFEKSIYEFPLFICEIEGVYNDVITLNFPSKQIKVEACYVKHTTECYAYCFTETKNKFKIDIGKVNPIITQYGEEIKQLGYVPPKKILTEFSKDINFQVTFSDKTICAKDYIKDCTPKKLIIALDNFNCDNIFTFFKNCDMLIHESTFIVMSDFSQEDKYSITSQAVKKGHSTNIMASLNAMKIDAKKLVLTHFSNRYKVTDGKMEEETQIIKSCNSVGFKGEVITAYDFTEVDV